MSAKVQRFLFPVSCCPLSRLTLAASCSAVVRWAMLLLLLLLVAAKVGQERIDARRLGMAQ